LPLSGALRSGGRVQFSGVYEWSKKGRGVPHIRDRSFQGGVAVDAALYLVGAITV